MPSDDIQSPRSVSLSVLTSSSTACLRTCPRKYYFCYEIGLRRKRIATPLRFGSNYHTGLEALGKRIPVADAVALAVRSYEITPEWANAYDWAIESETVRSMLTGYAWRYSADTLTTIQTEQTVYVPLVNPATGRASQTFRYGGKIDHIAHDTMIAADVVEEYKTTRDDISPGSDYWLRLPIDPQTSGYFVLASHLGFDVAHIRYNATRKPTIAPMQIPTLDPNGVKIVLDANGERVKTKDGKKWRETGDTEKGYTLQSSPETAEQFGERLLRDIGERPDFYYQRHEIPKLWDEIDQWRDELWQQSQQLIEMRRKGWWYRNVSKMTCNNCEYANICLNRVTLDPEVPPVGYEYISDVHPELTEREPQE